MANEKKPFKKLTWRLAAIARCRQCSLSAANSKSCTVTGCALYPFRIGKPPKKDVNALDLLVFDDDPSSVIFRVRKNKDGEEDVVATNKEYSPIFEDDEDDDLDDGDSEE